MSRQNKIVILKGYEYTEEGPWCDLCDEHIGDDLYNGEVGYNREDGLKPVMRDERTNWQDYGGGKCPGCGQEYEYNEGYFPVLDHDQWFILKRQKGLN